jgi:hypothetical protein
MTASRHPDCGRNDRWPPPPLEAVGCAPINRHPLGRERAVGRLAMRSTLRPAVTGPTVPGMDASLKCPWRFRDYVIEAAIWAVVIAFVVAVLDWAWPRVPVMGLQ